MDKNELERRTKIFEIRVIQFIAKLPENKVTDVFGISAFKIGYIY